MRLEARDAVRGLRRSPVAAAVITVSLALAIGAAASVVTVLDRLSWRPLPVVAPDRLVTFARVSKSRGGTDAWPYPAFVSLADAPVFQTLVATSTVERAGVRLGDAEDDEAGSLDVGLVSGNYFSMLGLHASLGRVLLADDDAPNARPVAVVSERWWASRFAGDAGIVGRVLRLNGTSYAVVGVGPAGFTGDSVGVAVDFWVPIARTPQVLVERPTALSDARSNWVRLIGRLQSGVTIEQARDAVAGRIEPGWTAAQRADVRLEAKTASHGFFVPSDLWNQTVTILMAVVAIVLVIACANATVLFLARMAAREQGFAVRLALGASRAGLVRLGLIEPLALTLAAGAIGTWVAAWASHLFVRIASSGRAPFALEVSPDLRTLAVMLAITLLAAGLCGVLPAWWISRVSPGGVLKSGGRGTGSAALSGGRLLVVLQVGLALALTSGAALFTRTLTELQAQELGFDRDRVLLFWLAPRTVGVQHEALAPLFAEAPSRVAAIAGVAAVGASSDGVLSGFIGLRDVAVPGRSVSGDTTAQWNLVGPGFLQAVGMRLIVGRDVSSADTANAAPVAIVNEAMARYFFGTTDVIGRRFTFGSALQTLSIVGVVQDAKYFSLRDANTRMVLLPFQQDLNGLYRMCLVVRTAGPTSAAVVTRIRAELRAVNPNVPLGRVETMDGQIAATLVDERLVAWLVGGLAVVSLVLACLGVYALMAYTVSRQLREMAVRSAIGASPGIVLRLVLGRALAMVLMGLVVGAPLSLVAVRSVRSFLFGVSPADPASLIGASAVLTLAGVIGALVPARRAARVDPLATLRAE